MIFVIIATVLFVLLLYLVITQIKENMDQTDPMLMKIQEIISPVHPKIPSLEFYIGKKSYTINKEKIYICLRDKDSNYYHMNHLIYVCLHEVAHVLCDEVGHTEKFHEIFDSLLEKATQMGIFNPSIPIIRDYCNY